MTQPTSTLVPQRPRNWDRRVSAAYLRMSGLGQAAAAKAIGINARTLRGWESETDLWSAARNEARDRWFNDAEDAARQAVLKSMRRGNADLGLKVLERIDRRLAPPVQRVDGKVEGEMTHRYVIELPLETEGLDSLPPAQVLGRDLGALPPAQLEAARGAAVPLQPDTHSGPGNKSLARSRSRAAAAEFERLRGAGAMKPSGEKPETQLSSGTGNGKRPSSKVRKVAAAELKRLRERGVITGNGSGNGNGNGNGGPAARAIVELPDETEGVE